MSDTTGASATVERSPTEGNVQKDKALWDFWMNALALAHEEEKDWREQSERVIKRYRMEKEFQNTRFNILYSNVQTMAPALFNSEPVPDIRRRFGDRDEDARQVAQALERCVSCNVEKSDFMAVMDEAVLHRLLPGRGVVRVRYEAKFGEDGQQIAYEQVGFECVTWADYRQGPAKRWKDMPWEAFRIYPTREELEELSPEHGAKVPLNAKMGSGEKGTDETRNPPDVYKRAEIWQIWDKEKREIVYICPDYEHAPVAIKPDPLKLEGFYPNPEPLLALRSPDDLRPLCEFYQYAYLADELDDITQRLRKLALACRYRGVTAKELGPAFSALQGLDDGQFAQADDALVFSQDGGIDRGIYVMPIAELVAAIQQLSERQELVKQNIFEITGMADIMRGATEASETATAQQIKAQWGSLRLQKAQGQVQRYCRDLFRLAVEIIATKFQPQSIMLASGIQLSEQQIALMRRDVMREYRIDVETDSTIRADLTRQQENIGQFVQGFGALVTALGPVVQEGVMPGDVAADLLTGFARSFKLGRQAEEALERLGDQARQAAQQGPKPDPEQQKMQMEMQLKQQESQMKMAERQQELQFRQQELQMELQMKQAEMALKEQELGLKQREMEMRQQGMQAEQQFKMQAMTEQAAFDREQMQANAAHEDERRTAEMDFMKRKQAMKPNGAEARQ